MGSKTSKNTATENMQQIKELDIKDCIEGLKN